MLNVNNLTIGADPEFFVVRGRHFISGHHFQCGSKEEPMATPNGWIQNDGVALECNIKPAKTQDEFVKNCLGAVSDLREFVKSKDPKADIVARPSIFIGKKKLSSLPPYVRALGCTPDVDAYLITYRNPPNADAPFRTGSGHIHVGWTDAEDTDLRSSHGQDCIRLARQLDIYLGLPSLLWDKDRRRQQLYGTPGSCRVKHYGVEYRVLSNKWLEAEDTMRFVFQQTVKAVSALAERKVVNNRHAETARKYIRAGNTDWINTRDGRMLLAEVDHV